MTSTGFRIFCITIAVLFFFVSAFSTAFIGDTQSSGFHKNSYGGVFGYQRDDDSGLMLLGHRYYDPSTGRFLSRDSVKDGSNWYAYCRSNPLKFADPTGNIVWFAAGLIFALVLTPTHIGQDPQEDPVEKDYTYETILWTAVIPIEGIIVSAGAKLLKWLSALRTARATAAFEALVEEAAKKIPSSWGRGRPTRKGGGTRWSDPSNPNNSVRIDPADPNSPFPSQRQPHVVVNSGGRVVGKYGPLPPNSRIRDFAEEAHIRLDEWLKWPQWNSPIPK